jgi:UDP-glucose 4-epimerase
MKPNNLLAKNTIYSGVRVLVTGSAGFIGRYLVDALQTQGAIVGPIVRFASNGITGGMDCDLRDAQQVQDLVRQWKPEFIFHLATKRTRKVAGEAIRHTLENNLTSTINLLEAARNCSSLQRVVMLGSAEEYGGTVVPFQEEMREAPISAYSVSKVCETHLGQMMARACGMPVIIVRPTIVYGPGQQDDMFLPALIQSLLHGLPFSMTSGEQTRDFLYVADLVDALLLAAHCSVASGTIINAGSENPIRIADLAIKVEKILGVSGLVRLGSLPMREAEVMQYAVDCNRARTALGWVPRTSLELGLRQTITWFQANQTCR